MFKLNSVFQVVFILGHGALLAPAYGSSYYNPDEKKNSSNKVVLHACKDRVREAIWSDNRYIQKVEFSGKSFGFRKNGKNKTSMNGKGRLLNRKNRWKDFTFACNYNHRRDEVSRFSYQKNSNNSNNPGYGADPRRACRHEIDRKVLNQYESASRIRWNNSSVRERRESRFETNFTGSGDFIGGRGRYKQFRFQCIYNQKHDDVHNAWVNVR